MASASLRREEGLGLAVAIAAHVGLAAVLLLRPESGEVVTPPERIEVTISDDVALTSTSPSPYVQPAPDIAPTLGEAAPMAVPDQAEPVPLPPVPVAQPEPRPAPAPPAPERPRRRAEPTRPTPRPAPPKAKAEPAPKPAPSRAERRETPKPAAPSRSERREAARPAPAKAAPKPAAKPATKSGGSRLGDDFLDGVAGGQSTSKSSSPPAATIGPQVRASLSSAITRQLKPHWQAPQGPEAEELVTILSFSLNRDGSLSGTPRVVRQTGVTSVNAAQKDRHAEQAIRAVQLAAPFNLPEEYYDAWKRVSSFRFDKRL